jgi:GTP-binding protein LepA
MYTRPTGEEYIFNLIDTPGHVDFSYEVSRSIAACEGALLLVDASQGIQAQTISNLYLAVDHNLEIIPIVNKVDMESAMVEEVQDQIIDLIGCKREDIISASGRTGIGIPEILAAAVDRIPAPSGDPERPLQTMIFDSMFNSYRGVVAYVRVMNGTMKKGDKIKFYNTGKEVWPKKSGVSCEWASLKPLKSAPAMWAMSLPASKSAAKSKWAIRSPTLHAL